MSRSEKRRRKKKQRMLRRRERHQKGQSAGLTRPITAERSPGRLPGGLKMSEVISHLAEPLIDQMGTSPDKIESVIMMTVLAWNVSLFPPEQRAEQLQAAARKVMAGDSEAIAQLHWICDLIAERKRKFYPHLNQFILDVHFTREPDDSVYFEVAYRL